MYTSELDATCRNGDHGFPLFVYCFDHLVGKVGGENFGATRAAEMIAKVKGLCTVVLCNLHFWNRRGADRDQYILPSRYAFEL
jgi:hypothetical protein